MSMNDECGHCGGSMRGAVEWDVCNGCHETWLREQGLSDE